MSQMKIPGDSPFERWFLSQYGRLPTKSDARQKLVDRVDFLEHELKQARLELKMDDNLFNIWQAAMWAWSAAFQKALDITPPDDTV